MASLLSRNKIYVIAVKNLDEEGCEGSCFFSILLDAFILRKSSHRNKETLKAH